MIGIGRRHRAGLIVALTWCALGCGKQGPPVGSAGATTTIALTEVGEMYRTYVAKNNKPPKKIDDIRGLRQIAQAGFGAVNSGAVVVLWEAPMSDTSEEGGKDAADEILAYEKEAPVKGGQVLMLNRTVRTMTPEEFQAAKKAGKEGPPPSKSKKS